MYCMISSPGEVFTSKTSGSGKEMARGVYPVVLFRVLNFLQKFHYVDFHHLYTVFTHFFHVLHYQQQLL